MRAEPTILEINTWPWLAGLTAEEGELVTLATVPSRVWDRIADRGFDAVWLMGVWQRSPAGITIALDEEPLVETFRAALDDYSPDDVVGSPYCVRDYVVDDHLGGPAGLKIARAELASRGVGLILDWVPNHVAADHPWTPAHPEWFVRGEPSDLDTAPFEFVRVSGAVIANGRDPHFAPWRDVLQINAFDPGLRREVVTTLISIADQCDGVRCDMAMLMLNDIFARTWSGRVGEPPADEYWTTVINEVRSTHPDFVFMAEAYWGTENTLREQGFDYCYDKALYDAVEHHRLDVGAGLEADLDRQRKSVRFIENHDEPRAQTTFGDGHRCAAVAVLTLPGARLVYDGQSAGRQIRTPVQLGRDPVEPMDTELDEFYARLLNCLADNIFHDGRWRRCAIEGWHDNPAGRGLLAWEWTLDDDRWLIVVNLDDVGASGQVVTGWEDLAGQRVDLDDPVSGEHFAYAGDDVAEHLFVRLEPAGFHVFHVVRR